MDSVIRWSYTASLLQERNDQTIIPFSRPDGTTYGGLNNVVNIMHVITGLNVGGAEVMLTKLLSAMDPDRFRHSVLSLQNKGPIGCQIEKLGLPVYELNLHRPVFSIYGLFKLRTILLLENPDLIQGWMYHGNLFASLFCFIHLFKRPIIWNIRCSLNDLKQEKFLTQMAILAGAHSSRSPAGIIYNSHVSADQHAALGYFPGKAHIVPNGFDLNRFKPNAHFRQKLRSELGIPEDGILIGLIARYHPMKDHENFLQAASLMARERAEVRFLMLGRGVDKPSSGLTRLIVSSGLKYRVTCLGERMDVESYYAALDIASLSSSHGEGFPNVIGEAMACAIPCVVTDVGDSRWLVGKTGIVVPPKDPMALKKGWDTLINKGQAERANMGRAARKRILENFTISSVAALYEEQYQQVIDLI
jgi:glycosyltransferase involved in cell wall biosynthesis